jgi:hypothetical protein
MGMFPETLGFFFPLFKSTIIIISKRAPSTFYTTIPHDRLKTRRFGIKRNIEKWDLLRT